MTVSYVKSRIASSNQFGGAPYGNNTKLPFNITTNSSGQWVDGAVLGAPTAADELLIGILPAGAKLIDALMIVSAAFSASVTAKVGFRYVDGVDVPAVPQNATYFTASLVLNAAGRYLANNTGVAPVTLPKDAYLVIDWDGATSAQAGVCDIIVDCILTGAP